MSTVTSQSSAQANALRYQTILDKFLSKCRILLKQKNTSYLERQFQEDIKILNEMIVSETKLLNAQLIEHEETAQKKFTQLINMVKSTEAIVYYIINQQKLNREIDISRIDINRNDESFVLKSQ